MWNSGPELGVLHARLDMQLVLLVKQLEQGARTMDDATYNGINQKIDHIHRVINRLQDRVEKLGVTDRYQHWYERWTKMYQTWRIGDQ